ncbi:MAG: PIN domain-containing protein [bacterium]|nr:PIN domain-containing protein [bacterium]
MIPSVIDTNVLVVANGRDTHACRECRLATIEALRSVMVSSALILDAGRRILDEYRKHCDHSGRPEVGDEFFRWAFDHAAALCSVKLTENEERGFDEFPDDPALAQFDRDDRVFVAVSVAAGIDNVILNAVDSDYQLHRGGLDTAGVVVKELCPSELKAVGET